MSAIPPIRLARFSPETGGSTTVEGPGQEMVQKLYHELRRLAGAKLGRMPGAGQTLQPTALVHEAYMRLSRNPDKIWQGRRHFYRAAAVAMRHILIERARAKKSARHGGGWQRTEITISLADHEDRLFLAPEDVLTLDRALHKLGTEFPELVELALMRYFCGLTVPEIADLMGVTTRTIERKWSFTRAWLLTEIDGVPAP
jgi:RNA polymerase sigma factor (TIGR02999 family)